MEQAESVFVEPGGDVADVGPVGGIEPEFGIVGEDVGQRGRQPGIIRFDDGEQLETLRGVADESDGIFGAGEEFLHQQGTAGELGAEPGERGDEFGAVLRDALGGDADAAVAAGRFYDNWETRGDG